VSRALAERVARWRAVLDLALPHVEAPPVERVSDAARQAARRAAMTPEQRREEWRRAQQARRARLAEGGQ
jgi:hypothetical protein